MPTKLRLLPLMLLSLLGSLLLVQAAFAQQGDMLSERILDFHTEIQLNADSSVDVTETIRFNVRNHSIRHGILRDIPIRHGMGVPVRVPLRVKEVRLDGVPEDFDVQHEMEFTRIKIGSSRRIISTGEHVYTIRYSAPRQVRNHDEFDEIYWNATGNFWAFPIDHARATVLFPDDIAASRIELNGYTGPVMSTQSNYQASIPELGRIEFETTQPLSYYEGLTISATFPRGSVLLDTPAAQSRLWLLDNGYWAGGLVLLAVCMIYFLVLWFMVGRDPQVGLVLREETPLIGLSPASLRYIWRMGADSRILSAVMLQLAQKGWLIIEETDEDEYRIRRTDVRDGELLPEERIFMDRIFSGRRKHFEIDVKNQPTIAATLSAIGAELNREYHHVYFERNSSYIGRGSWVCIIGFMLHLALGLAGIYLPNYLVLVLLGILLLILIIVFAVLMPAYNALGRAVLDRIEGFRLAMMGGEDSFGQYVYADTVLTERYLAHATALNVNEQWGQHFAKAMERQGRTVDSPGWYHSHTGRSYMYANGFNYAGFSNAMPSSFSKSVSTSSTPPSSSGSGGGGFSGGGGGGGGGSGW